MDITVVGAGVLGLSSALALAEQGHNITVLEKTQPGAGASGRAGGIVSTMTWNDDDFRLIQETRGRIGELISHGIAAGSPAARHLWRSHDSLTIAKGPGLAIMDDVQKRLERNGEEPERFGHLEAAKRYSELRLEPGEEILVAQEDGVVEPGDLVQLLVDLLGNEDVAIRTHQATLDETGRVVGGPDADAVVVAGGAWTKNLLAAAGVQLPIDAFRTQAASLAMRSTLIVHDTVKGTWSRPESAQSMLAGDGTVLKPHDPDDFNEAADPEFQESIARRVVERFKRGEHATWRQGWAGLPVATPDRRPLCGKVADGLYVLTGDNGYGVMRCLALGERLADTVRGKAFDSTNPMRFGAIGDWQMKEGFGW